MALSVSTIVCAVAALSALFIAHHQPWLGVTLHAEPEYDLVWIREIAARGPSAQLPSDEALASVNGVELTPTDLIEEPDGLASYDEVNAFMARQQILHEALRANVVALESFTALGSTHVEVRPNTLRPIGAMPLVFWIQIFIGFTSAMIGTWVWSLRRGEPSTQLLMLAGFSILVMTYPAAIYSTREIALSSDLFRWLAAIDHFGALSFGATMLMLFLIYPHRVAPRAVVWAFPAVIGAWWAADTAQVVFDGPPTGFHLPAVIMMALFFPIAFLQHRKTKGDPVARAALGCFALAVTAGAGVFVAVIVAPRVFGVIPAIPQGYAFTLFLVVFAGVAAGVARYRLFDLDRWALVFLFYFVGALLLLVIDATLITFVSFERMPAFGAALLLVALLYLPLRDVLARGLFKREGPERGALFRRIVDVALARERDDQHRAWRQILVDVFRPLNTVPYASNALSDPEIADDGVALIVPGAEHLPPFKLSYAQSGVKLFSTRDRRLAAELCAMLSHALASSRAHDLGVATERARIARDMHDNIGAQLLSALHSDASERKDTLIREAISDLRNIVNDAGRGDRDLGEVLADLKLESLERLSAAGIALDWRTGDCAATLLTNTMLNGLRSILRETVSNTIRHSGAKAMAIDIDVDAGALHLAIADDGAGRDPSAHRPGNGLSNIEARLIALDGALFVDDDGPGFRLRAHFPVSEDAAS